MNELYIYHHLGLGDHILCNAIVRNYAKQYDKIYLFVKPHNYKNVSFMYRDLTNIDYIRGEDFIANSIISGKTNVLKIGFEKLDVTNYKFDESFYRCIGMDFEKKWTDFYVQRDLEKEKNIFNSLNLKENEYIFIQEDRNRGFTLDMNRITSTLSIVSSELPFDFFDFCYILENAKEVHLMESSFKCLVDFLDIKGQLFYHRYVRSGYPTNIESSTKKNWIEL